MMGYNSQTKVILVNLPKKISFLGKGNLLPIWSKIMQPCLRIHSVDKSSLSHFSKKISFLGNIGPFGSKLHNQLLYRFLETFQHEFVIVICKFPKTLAKIMQLYTHDLLYDKYFDMAQHDGIQQLDQSNVGQLFQKILVWRSNSHPVRAKLIKPSVLLFAL